MTTPLSPRSLASNETLAWRGAALLAALVLGGATQASAGDWKWSVSPYAWTTNVGVDASVGDREVVDETITFNDLLEDLDTAAQVHVDAQHGRHGVMFDIFTVRLSQSDEGIALPQGAGSADLASKMSMTILELGGIFDPTGDQKGFGLLYGTRVLAQSFSLDAELEPAPGMTIGRSYDTEDTLVDGLLGVRYILPLSHRWTTLMRADVSSGGTDLTWSAAAAVAYAFGKSGRYAITGGYRHMVVNFDDDEAVDVSMTLSGPFVGLRLAF